MVEWSIAAVLKTVETRVSGGSNPSLCAKNTGRITPSRIFFDSENRAGFEGGAVLREQNALPCEGWITACMKAKDDVDNVGAGRAAKGANPSLCAKKKTRDWIQF